MSNRLIALVALLLSAPLVCAQAPPGLGPEEFGLTQETARRGGRTCRAIDLEMHA